MSLGDVHVSIHKDRPRRSHPHERIMHIPSAVPSIVLNITVTGSSDGVNFLMTRFTTPSVSVTL